MTVITPNFTDQQKPKRGRKKAQNGVAPPEEPVSAPAVMHVVAPHEPLTSEPFALNMALQPTVTYAVSPFSVIEAQPEKKALKIALIGTAPSSRMLAPFNDPSWTIWACSPGNMNALPRYDAWFEVHSNLLWPEHASYGPQYIEWLKQLKCPVYMQDQSQVPNAVSFPWKDLVAEFGEDFFTSSFAWMMAFAMQQGAQELALYGIDMASRDEYILQRPGFYFFRHEARRRGIKVTAPHESDIMQSPPLYAISESHPFGRKLLARKKEIQERLAQMTAQRDSLNHNITYLQGALEDNDYTNAIWSGLGAQMMLKGGD